MFFFQYAKTNIYIYTWGSGSLINVSHDKPKMHLQNFSSKMYIKKKKKKKTQILKKCALHKKCALRKKCAMRKTKCAVRKKVRNAQKNICTFRPPYQCDKEERRHQRAAS